MDAALAWPGPDAAFGGCLLQLSGAGGGLAELLVTSTPDAGAEVACLRAPGTDRR